MSDPAPRHRRTRRPRPTPQRWPLPRRRRGCRRWLAAVGLGTGVALVLFAVVLALAPMVGAL